MSDDDNRDDDNRDEERDWSERDPQVDATGATPAERQAKEELFEAIDHFKSAASILFSRARNDPAVKSATEEAGRVVRKVGDAAEPLARQLADELGRLTRDVMDTVEGSRGKRRRDDSRPPSRSEDEEE